MPTNREARRKELRNRIYRLQAAEFSKCFWHEAKCEQPAIRAHSVQNARVLDLLVRDGHLVGFTRRMAPTGPQIDFGLVGRHRATTFGGLCAQHDEELFGPLDRGPFDPENPHHLFLVAYRAVHREFHAACAAGWRLQMGYQQRVALGFDSGNAPSPAGLLATDRMIRAYDTYEYKQEVDAAFDAGDYGAFVHDVLALETEPTIAVCSLFMQGIEVNGVPARIALNVLPLAPTRTVAVCSYLIRDARTGRATLDRVLDSAGMHQKYELSRRVLNFCENMVVAPAYFDRWSDRKKAVVRDYFVQTIHAEDPSFEDPDLMLF